MLVESIYRTCITNWVARSDGYIVIINFIIDFHGLGRGGCVFVVFMLSVGDSMHSVGGSFSGALLILYIATQWDPACLTQDLVVADRKW